MKLKKIMLASALSLSVTAIIAGCGSTTNASASTPSARTPQKGGTLVWALSPQTNINWYFPYTSGTYDLLQNYQLINQLYKPLLMINNAYNIDYHQSIADKITYNKNGTVYHVYLNPKWKWSDGVPVTTKDIEFAWQVDKEISQPNAPNPWAGGSTYGDVPDGVKSLTLNGNYEFTITLKAPVNQEWFIYNGISQLTPIPAQVWNKYPNNIIQEVKYLGAQGTNPNFDTVVDGPFKLQSAIANESWTLVPNPTYPGQKPYVSKFVMAYEGSNSAEFAALKTGAVQVGYLDNSEYGARGELLSTDVIRPAYPLAFNYLNLNMLPKAQSGMGPIFSKLYVRQALQMGIDQKAMDSAIYEGFGPPQYGPIPVIPKTKYLDPALAKPLYPYSISAAKKLLESHGWREVDGVMTKGSAKMQFTVMYSSGTTSLTDQMALIQQDWAKMGVKVQLKPEPFATMVGINSVPQNASQWAVAGGIGWIYGGSYPTGGSFFDTAAAASFGWNNAEENTLINATHAPHATNAETLKAFYNYEYFTAKELPVLWLNQTATLEVNEKTVHNSFKYSNALTGGIQPQYWWISKS